MVDDNVNVPQSPERCCLLPGWNPLMEQWGPESTVMPATKAEDARVQDAWEDMRMALESEAMEARSKVRNTLPAALWMHGAHRKNWKNDSLTTSLHLGAVVSGLLISPCSRQTGVKSFVVTVKVRRVLGFVS